MNNSKILFQSKLRGTPVFPLRGVICCGKAHASASVGEKLGENVLELWGACIV